MRQVSKTTILGTYLCCAVSSFSAHAKQAEAEPPMENEEEQIIETIIVTGQKRDETLVESDLSVTVLDELAIQEARIRDVRRIDDLVPNVQFNETGQLSSVFVSIRGVESNPFIVNRAAIYIDGIPFRELSNAVLNQIQSVEVLRGPQSTLYGANSEAGLILINTRQPTDELNSQIRVTGSTYNGNYGLGVDGFLGGTLVDDKLLGSVAFKASRDDAYITNPVSSSGEPGEVRDLFLQGRISFRPTDRLTINATAYILDTNAPGLFEQEYSPIDRDVYNALYQDFFNNGRAIGRFEFLNDTPKFTREQNIVGGTNATYELDYGKIDAAVSYAQTNTDTQGLDLDLTALPTAAGAEIETEEIYSGEIRFTSPDSDIFEYIIGGSWYQETDTQQLGTAFGPALLGSYLYSPEQTGNAQDFALFASASAGLGIPRLSGTVGIRWDHANRRLRQEAGVLDAGFTELVFSALDLEETFQEVLPRFVLSYQVSDYLNLYASAAEGYIPGGFNLAAAEAEFSDDIVRFGKENVWTYEVGAKFAFPNGRGYVNTAAFYIQSDNWQEVQVILNDEGAVASTGFISSNAAIETTGFEIETIYNITNELKVSANLGYVEAIYQDFQVSETENLRGLPVKLVPEYDANVALRYEAPFGFFARGELSFTGRTPLNERNDTVRPDQTIVNLQTGYEGEHYSVRLFAENLTNVRIPTGLATPNFSGPDGTFYAPLDAPRVVGLELEYNF